MKIKDRMSIDDLYFGVVLMPMSYSSYEERTKPRVYNLFDFSRVRWAVARWVTMKPEERRNISNPLSFLFGDVWGRTEYEFIMCPWPYKDNEKVEDSGVKVDTYKMYVEPNADLLMNLVSRVSKTSARRYLTEWRKRYSK